MDSTEGPFVFSTAFHEIFTLLSSQLKIDDEDEADQAMRPESVAGSHVQDMIRVLGERDQAMQRAREPVVNACTEDIENIQPEHDPATEYTPLLNKVV